MVSFHQDTLAQTEDKTLMTSVRQFARRKARDKKSNNLDITQTRYDFIEKLESGEAALQFVEDIKKYGTNEKGEPLKVRPWLEEYARLIADVRIAETYTSGSAQIGKSLLHALLQVWLVVECRLNVLYVFAQETALNRMVPIQFKPLFASWMERKGIVLKATEGSRNNRLIQVKGGTGIFSYVGTSKLNRDGRAAAGSSIVSFSVDLAFCDERSQYPPGAADPVYRRLDAGRLSSHPIRLLGTPGSGIGIEEEIERADHHFYPHVKCPNCHKETSLHPFGALLTPNKKTNESGETEIKYLSESGKPESWRHDDEFDPVGSAYFSCIHCSYKLETNDRIHAHFTCLHTGTRLTEFLDNFENPNGKRYKVGITLSPLLRESNLNLAAEIIQGGLDSSNPADWQQQRLGLPSQGGDASLSINQIKRAIYAPEPVINKAQERWILGGIDQGRSFDYLCITEFVLPSGYERLSVNDVLDQSLRIVKFAGAIPRSEIATKLNHYQCSTGLCDNEPSISSAAELVSSIGWQLADQKPRQKDATKEIIVRDGGEEFSCWGIRNDRFLRAVKNIFITKAKDGYPLVRLPKSWESWLNNPTELSPIKHLTSLSYDSSTGNWIRPQDHNDDVYYAFMFCEAAFYLQLTGDQYYSSWFNFV
jgi:hypothetical protein